MSDIFSGCAQVRNSELTNNLQGAKSFFRSCQYTQFVKKFSAFSGARMFIAVFTRARHR
jgi:hypothetical protein